MEITIYAAAVGCFWKNATNCVNKIQINFEMEYAWISCSAIIFGDKKAYYTVALM